MNVAMLNREAFDAIEFDATCSGDYRSAAERMSRLAETGTQTAAMTRAEAYVRAGEQWLLADEPAAAAHAFTRAIEDGGPSSADPRVPLARALFLLGRDGEAEAHLRRLAHEPPRDPRMCDQVAELMVERGDLIGALAWAGAGVQLCLGGAPGPVEEAGSAEPAGGATPSAAELRWRPAPELRELRLLLNLRFRIRNDLSLDEDDYDRLLDVLPSDAPGPATTG